MTTALSGQDGWRGAGRPRRYIFYGLASLFTAVLGLDFVHHLLDFSQDGGVHHVHVAMHAVLTGSMLVGMGVQLRSPAKRVAGLQQAFVISIIATAGAAASGNFAVRPIAFIAVGLVISLLHPARAQLLRPGPVNGTLLVVAVLAAPLVIGYALGQFHLQVIGADPIHADRGHYALMAEGRSAFWWWLLWQLSGSVARGCRPGPAGSEQPCSELSQSPGRPTPRALGPDGALRRLQAAWS